MTLPNAYLITTKNVEAFFNALVNAQAPERVTQKFLESLEFKSTNDRLYIGLLKALGLTDDSNVPNQIYFEFLDQTQSKRILAECIKKAYSDIFVVKKDANTLSVEEVKNKFKTLTQGQKSDDVLRYMANTFKALCDYSDFSKTEKLDEAKKEKDVEHHKVDIKPTPAVSSSDTSLKVPSLQYNIQIHLPATRDIAIYDAIFKSLKDHLLK